MRGHVFKHFCDTANISFLSFPSFNLNPKKCQTYIYTLFLFIIFTWIHHLKQTMVQILEPLHVTELSLLTPGNHQ